MFSFFSSISFNGQWLSSQGCNDYGADGGKCADTSQNHGRLLRVIRLVGLGRYHYLASWLDASLVQTAYLAIGVYDECLAAMPPTADATGLIDVERG